MSVINWLKQKLTECDILVT